MKIVNFWIIIFLLVFSSASSAFSSDYHAEFVDESIEQNAIENVSIFEKGYDRVSEFIGNNEYLITSLSGVIVGGVLCGPWCMLVGGVAGVIDESLVYLNYADRRYLTWGIIGATTGNIVNPGVISGVSGFVVGILLPTGIFNQHSELVAPIMSTIAGGSISGVSGMVQGGMGGITDELSIRGGYTDGHYMTFNTIGIAAANLFVSPAVANFLGTVLGLIASSYEEKIIESFYGPMETTKILHKTYSKFLPQEYLDSHIEKHALVTVGTQLLTQILSLQIMGYRQNLRYNFEHLNVPGNQAWRDLGSGVTKIAIFLFPYAIGKIVSNGVDSYFNEKLQLALEEQIRSDLFSEENFLRLSQNSNSTMLMDNLGSDLDVLITSGGGLMTSAISSSIEGVYGVGIIIISSPNVFIYSILYNKASAFVAEYIALQQKEYMGKISILSSDLVSTIKHESENIRTITERDGVEVTKEKIRQLSLDLRKNERMQYLWGMANKVWDPVSDIAGRVLIGYFIAYEINGGRVSFEDRHKIQLANRQLSSLLSWPMSSAQEVVKVYHSLDRIIILEGLIHESSNSKDRIHRIFNDTEQLELYNLEIGFGEEILVKVDKLKFDMGKIYAITGKTGCGKSSLLSKIKGIKENGVFGKGSIYYPMVNNDPPKIIMISQQDYFLKDATLGEIITYPNKISDDQYLNSENIEKMQLLLNEIGILGFAKIEGEFEIKKNSRQLKLYDKKDWYTYLSGGEKKKIAIISAIIKKPDILILDEIFNGLDSESIFVAQKMLKKYLPDSLILIVDHHAKDNNYEGFYNGGELHFLNESIIHREIMNRVM